MMIDDGHMGPVRKGFQDPFGPNPPKGVYFQTEYEYNLNHPRNRDMDVENCSFTGSIVRTLDEARTMAFHVATVTASNSQLTVVEDDPDSEEDTELNMLPTFYLVDSENPEGENSVVMMVSVLFLDFREETLH